MSQIIKPSTGGGGQPSNPNISYEHLGYDANGLGTQITSGGGANTKGAWTSLGVLSSDICEFDLIVAAANSSGSRVVCDVGIGPNSGAVTTIVPDLYEVTSQVGTTHAPESVPIPLKLAAGQEVWARIAAQGSGQTQLVSLRGIVADPSLPPGFDNCAVIHGNGANVRAGSISVPSDSATYTELVASSARSYGAVLCSVGQTTTTGSNMALGIRWGIGASGSETDFLRTSVYANTSNPILKTGGVRRLVRKSFASGIRFAVRATSANTTETFYAGLHGFY